MPQVGLERDVVCRRLLGLVALAAILLCCLMAGTPVNNDPSPAAEVAGIHLAPHPVPVRAAVTQVAPPLVGSTFAGLLAVAVSLVVLHVRGDRQAASPDDLIWARSGTRRGPPFARS